MDKDNNGYITVDGLMINDGLMVDDGLMMFRDSRVVNDYITADDG